MFKKILLQSFFCGITLLFSCNKNESKSDILKLFPVKVGNEFQYINQDGKIIINPQFTQATVFRDGLALVQSSGDDPKWGYINEDGKFVIPAIYQSATVFSDKLAWVISKNAAPTAINSVGEVQFTLQNVEDVTLFKDGLAGFSKLSEDGIKLWGFVDKKGQIKINSQFLSIGDFTQNKCAVSNTNGKWGYINDQGKILINYQFDNAKPFINNKAIVGSGGKFGLIDENGKYLINPQFDSMENDGDIFLIQQGGRFGWADSDGKIIINPQFLSAFPFAGGKLAAVRSTTNWEYIDKEGEIIINPQFDKAFPFNGSLALVVSANKIGFITDDGKYSINPQFDGAPDDLAIYLQSGNTAFNAVTTDFFDLNSIINTINLDKPEGVTLDMPISKLLEKFNIDTNQVNKNSNQTALITSKKLSSDATLDFYFYGTPWVATPVQQSSGWNQTTVMSYHFIKELVPSGFLYVINLSRKGLGKETMIKETLVNKMTGYKYDAAQSVGNSFVYTGPKQTVSIQVNSGQVNISCFPFPNGD